MVRVGARWRPKPSFELRLSGEFARWSVFDRQCVLDRAEPARSCKVLPTGEVDVSGGGKGVLLNIERRWKDAWGIRVGASYFVRDNFELFIGFGYDANAVPDQTLEASLVDMDKFLITVGGKAQLVKRKLGLKVSYTQIVFLDRTVAPHALTLQPPAKSPDGGGTYTQSVGTLGLALEYLFL